MLGLITQKVAEVNPSRYFIYQDKIHFPKVLQGEKELQTLCPVSKLTGFPMSIQEAITMLSDKNSRLVEMFTQELPTIVPLNVSDDEKLSLLISRLDTGSFAENDAVTKEISKYAEVFFPEADKSLIESLVKDVQQNVENQKH